MSNDSKAADSTGRGPQNGPAAAQAPAHSGLAADAALYAIGYEAADPTLQSGFWADPEPTSSTPRSR